MSLTTKTLAALVAIFVALLAGAWLILDRSVRPSFLSQEAAAHEADLAHMQGTLRTVATDMRARALDYARWDDTFNFLAGREPTYIADNFSESWFTNYGADLIIFADDAGRLVWWRQRGLHAGLNSAGLAGTLIQQANARAPHRSVPIDGVIWTADGPLLYAAARATRSDGGGATRGLVIIGRHLSANALQNSAQANLRFVNAGRVPSNLRTRFDTLSETDSLRWTSRDTLYTLVALRGASGQLAGAVLAERPRDLAALGERTIGSALTMLALTLAAAAFALWFVLHHFVFARLVRFERHLEAQRHGPAASPAPEDETQDEVGSLTRAYNAMTERLSRALERERQAISAQESAAAANRLKSDFLANISHELRTPLNDVIGYAELIGEDLADSGVDAEDDLRRITDAARHLLTLTNEILDLSRIEAERLDIRPEEFRIDEVLREAVDTASVLARAQSSLLRLECTGDLGTAYSDQARWRQCLVNVLAFACKRTHSGVVRLRVERRTADNGEALRFEIIDQGAPLNRAQTEALFEPYTRGDTAQAHHARLGLSVARKLAQLLGGAITVHMQPRVGCVFVLTLKASLDPDVSAKASAA